MTNIANMPATQPALERPSQAGGWPRPPLAPGWIAWTPEAAVVGALAYGAVRVWWAIHGAPSFGQLRYDLIYFSGWSAVCLCAVAAAVALALRIAPYRWPLLAAGWGVSLALLAACPLLLLDLVSALLPGLGAPFHPAAFMSRAACFIEGILVYATAVAYRRRWRSACLFCGRTGVRVRLAQTPWWAWWGAYAAVAGCLTRLGAQMAVGFGMMQRLVTGPRLVIEGLIFEAAFLLAGTLLPLALVHSWGRVVPRRVPMLAGRRVPRWLPLGPAFAISGLMTVYFGITFVKIAVDAFTRTASQSFGSFPPWFFWVAVPAYWIWGIGMGVAAIAYYRVTRPPCKVCSY